MTVQRLTDQINVPQWLATLLPIVALAVGAWVTISSRIAVLEDRVATHLESVPEGRIGRIESRLAVSDQAASEILRRLDRIESKVDELKRNGR